MTYSLYSYFFRKFPYCHDQILLLSPEILQLPTVAISCSTPRQIDSLPTNIHLVEGEERDFAGREEAIIQVAKDQNVADYKHDSTPCGLRAKASLLRVSGGSSSQFHHRRSKLCKESERRERGERKRSLDES